MPEKQKEFDYRFYGYALLIGVLLAIVVAVVVAVAVASNIAAVGRMGASTFGAASAVQAYSYRQTIMLSASGSASAVPAVAKVDVLVNSTGRTAAAANANLSAIVVRMNETVLPFLGGNTSDIQTTSYQINQATNCTYEAPAPYYCITHRLPYYVAQEGFEITVPVMGNASSVVTALSGLPGMQLQGVQAVLSTAQLSQLNQEALSAALANATGQAQLIAGGGAQLELSNVTVQSSQIIYPYGVYSVGAASAAPVAVNGNSTIIYGGTEAAHKAISVVFHVR